MAALSRDCKRPDLPDHRIVRTGAEAADGAHRAVWNRPQVDATVWIGATERMGLPPCNRCPSTLNALAFSGDKIDHCIHLKS